MAKTKNPIPEPEKPQVDPFKLTADEITKLLKTKGQAWTNGNAIEKELETVCHYSHIRVCLDNLVNAGKVLFDRGTFSYKLA